MNVSNRGSALLEVDNLQAWYGESHVLHGISFPVMPGEVVTLLGRNGAGKSTTLKAIMGIVEKRTGSIRLSGEETISLRSNAIARRGLGFCPEDRAIFAGLTVAENLMLPPVTGPGGLSLESIYELFPNIRERFDSYGGNLSGGEQQMLAIARLLRTGSKLILLDEPTEGLAPAIVQQIALVLRRLKAEGFTVLLVEQNIRFAATISDKYYVLETGRIVDRFNEIGSDSSLERLQAHLGV